VQVLVDEGEAVLVALFARRKGSSPGDDEPDGTFTYLTAAEAATVRSMVREAFAEKGLEVVVHADHVASSDGGQYGLTNIAALCRGLPRKEWPGATRRHVETVLRALATPAPDELSEAEVLQRVFVRVMGTSSLSDLAGLDYRRELGGDLVELLALDYEEHVALLRDDVVGRLDVDAVRHAGVANLLAEPFGEYHEVKADRRAGFGLVLGESVYTASRLLTMDDVLRRTVGEVATPDGLLVCVPTRHHLGFHVICDAAAVPMIEAMAHFAASLYSDGVGSVSPLLYWMRGGRLEPISRLEDDGTVAIDVCPELVDVLERLSDDAS
jgi:hypothetical protein